MTVYTLYKRSGKWISEVKITLVHGIGNSHLEVYKDEMGFKDPKIIHRETFVSPDCSTPQVTSMREAWEFHKKYQKEGYKTLKDLNIQQRPDRSCSIDIQTPGGNYYFFGNIYEAVDRGLQLLENDKRSAAN